MLSMSTTRVPVVRFSTRALPLFDATMPRRHARPDARDGDAASVDMRTRHPALERRAFASACTIFRGNAARRRIANPFSTAVFAGRTGNRSNRQSGSHSSRRVKQKYPARKGRRANSRHLIGSFGRDFRSEAEKTLFFFGPSRIRHLDRRGGRARAPTTRRVARPPRVTVSKPASEGMRFAA